MRAIGFTGTQKGMTPYQKVRLAEELAYAIGVGYTEFHHGDCIGADAEADAIARVLGYHITIHPPSNPAKRAYCYQDGDTLLPEKDYIPRNHDIVDATRILIAAPEGEEKLRSGTWSTVRYANKLGRGCGILRPRKEKE